MGGAVWCSPPIYATVNVRLTCFFYFKQNNKYQTNPNLFAVIAPIFNRMFKTKYTLKKLAGRFICIADVKDRLAKTGHLLHSRAHRYAIAVRCVRKLSLRTYMSALRIKFLIQLRSKSFFWVSKPKFFHSPLLKICFGVV